MDHDPMQLAAALAASMTGHTQKHVADVTGIDQGRLSRLMRYERNERPTLDELARVEAACGHPAGYILSLAGIVTVEGARAGARARVAADRKGSGRSA